MDAAVGQGRYEQKQSTAFFLQRKIPVKRKIFVIFSSLKSKVSPTQIYLNFRGKVWHCKLYIIKQYIYRLDFIYCMRF